MACPAQISKLCTSQNKPSQLGRNGFGQSLTYLVVPFSPSAYLSVWYSLWCKHLVLMSSTTARVRGSLGEVRHSLVRRPAGPGLILQARGGISVTIIFVSIACRLLRQRRAWRRRPWRHRTSW